jgi:hypothetical protein
MRRSSHALAIAATAPDALVPAAFDDIPRTPLEPLSVSADSLRIALDDHAVTAFAARRPTSAARLPDPRRWAARLATAIAETLNGLRPLQQLLRWTDDRVYDELAGMLARRPHAVPAPTPLLRSIQVCLPTDGVAEACAVIQFGARCRAVALRLEGLDGKWLCTEFELI